MSLLEWLWQITAGVQALYALRIWSVGLASRYPFSTAYLVVSPILITAGTVFRATSNPDSPNLIHGWFWVLTQPLSWILLFVVVVEILNRVLHDFAGFMALGQFVIRAATVLLGVLYLAVVANQSLRIWSEFWQYQQQTLFVMLSLFCVLILGFVAYWEIPISRNVWLLIAPFGLMIGANAFALSLLDLLGAGSLLNTIHSVVTPLLVIVSFGTGAFMFSRAGETTIQRPPNSASSVVIDQLDAMNDALKRIIVK